MEVDRVSPRGEAVKSWLSLPLCLLESLVYFTWLQCAFASHPVFESCGTTQGYMSYFLLELHFPMPSVFIGSLPIGIFFFFSLSENLYLKALGPILIPWESWELYTLAACVCRCAPAAHWQTETSAFVTCSAVDSSRHKKSFHHRQGMHFQKHINSHSVDKCWSSLKNAHPRTIHTTTGSDRWSSSCCLCKCQTK